MPIHTENGTIPERLDYSLDNRDPGETWLQLEGTGDYVSVEPFEIMTNMIENCEHWLFEAEQGPKMNREEVVDAVQVLARACGRPTIEHPEDLHANKFNPYW